MRVNKDNFAEHFQDIQSAIRSSDFVSFDLEFSGLRFRHDYFPRTSSLDTNQSIFERFSYVGQNFLPLQIGISCFYKSPIDQASKKMTYEEKTYSFMLAQTDDSCRFVQSDCVNFLSRHKFDFRECFIRGLPYAQVKGEVAELVENSDDGWIDTLAGYLREKEGSDLGGAGGFGKKQYSKPVMAESNGVLMKIEAWIKESSESEVEMKTERKLTGEALVGMIKSKKDFGAVAKVTKTGVIIHRAQVNAAEVKVEEQKHTELSSLEWLAQRYGFSLVFLELMKAKVPIVGHFCIFDWLYIYGACYENIPKKLTDFLKGINTIFPTIFDTKCVVRDAKKFEKKLMPGLGKMFDHLKAGVTKPVDLIKSVQFDEELKHDAGYDSSITGYAFIYLKAIIISKQSLSTMKREDFLKTVGKLPEGNNLYLNSERIIDFDFEDDYDGVSADEKKRALLLTISSTYASKTEEDVDSLISQITSYLSDTNTFVYSRIHRLCLWLTIKDNVMPDMHELMAKLNDAFESKAVFTDYDSHVPVDIDRYWLNQLN